MFSSEDVFGDLKDAPKNPDSPTEEAKKEMISGYEEWQNYIANIDLIKASEAVIGMTAELGKLLKKGALDDAIDDTITSGGLAFQEVAVEVLEMYKELTSIIFDRFEVITSKLDGMNIAMSAVKNTWKEALAEHPKTALKILKYKKQLTKAFK